VGSERSRARDIAVAAAVAGAVAGAPSTLHALLTRRSPLEATLAAGTVLLPRESRPVPLLLAAVPVHAALSLGWAGVLDGMLRPVPRHRMAWAGAAAGLAIAALDLGLVARRYPRIRALPQSPQVADHVAFGLVVGWVLARRRGA
jgi:hypothetical protein